MNKNGKYLLITHHFPPVIGGISTLIEGFANHFPPHTLIVLAPEAENISEYDEGRNYKIYRGRFNLDAPMRSWPFQLCRLFILVMLILRKEKVEKFLIANILPTGIVGILLKFLTGRPYLLFTYGMDVFYPESLLRRFFISFILKRADKIVAISRYTKMSLGCFGVSMDKISIVHPATDLNLFHPGRDVSEIQQKYTLKNKKIILTVGRLDMRKGQDMVIRSLPSVLGDFPEVIYLIVGKGDDETRLISLVRENKIENYVYFIRDVRREELHLYYNLCDIFIMVSREVKQTGNVEGFGIVYLEANACGKPVIAGRSGGVEDAVIDGYTGLLVNPENLQEISNAIVTLLQNKILAEELGKNGLKRVREYFTWKRASGELYQVIKG